MPVPFSLSRQIILSDKNQRTIFANFQLVRRKSCALRLFSFQRQQKLDSNEVTVKTQFHLEKTTESFMEIFLFSYLILMQPSFPVIFTFNFLFLFKKSSLIPHFFSRKHSHSISLFFGWSPMAFQAFNTSRSKGDKSIHFYCYAFCARN